MSKVKNENFVAIQGWMVTELKLKGNSLLIYAIIYGFSQAEGQVFTGSLQYLSDWTNSTKQGVLKSLRSLIDAGLIGKKEKNINGVKFVEYYVTKFNGVLNKVERGIKQSLPNNIEDNIEDNIDTITKVIEQKAPKQFGNIEINELFNEWEKQCGFKIDSKVKQNRYACQRLIKSKGLNKTLKVLEIVSEAQKDKYAPGIYNFIDLAEKWNNLAVWYQKKVIMKKKTGVLIV